MAKPKPQAPLAGKRVGRAEGRQGPPNGPSGQVRDAAHQRAADRRARLEANRYAVPYPVDGPKVFLGVAWFVAILIGPLLGLSRGSVLAALVVLLVGLPVAGLAGLQAGFAWFPNSETTRTWTAAAAVATALPGMVGPIGAMIGLVFGAVVCCFYVLAYQGHRRSNAELFDVLARCSLPAGLAMGSLAALTRLEPGGINAAIALILLVSAYEVGDFLIGSGAANAFEGPMAGLLSLGVVTFFLFLLTPEPFTSTSALLFGALAAVACPLGQIAASAILPRGTAWAPALRRLDSYLIAAPLWLLLIALVPNFG